MFEVVCVCSLCGGMTDRGKQILWGARVNASPLLSLAASVRTYSHLLLPEEVKQRRRSVEENGRQDGDGRGAVFPSSFHLCDCKIN